MNFHFSRTYRVRRHSFLFADIIEKSNIKFIKMLHDLNNKSNIQQRLISSLAAEPEPKPKPTFLSVIVVASLLSFSFYFYYTESIKLLR